MVTVSNLLALLNELAPFSLAEPWDNVGLLLGDQTMNVERIGIALDVTPQVLAQAAEKKINCLITHHPLLFEAQKRFTADLWPDKAVLELARRNIALVAMHTNLDKAAGGVNDCLAARLQLQRVRPLIEEKLAMQKLVVFVPETHAEQVAQAVTNAGAGRLGCYRDCTFRASGTGTFRPLDGSNPYIGKTGELSRVAEVRIETIMPESAADQVIAAMLLAHPYEEPAYDVYGLLTDFKQSGLGRIGEWEKPLSMQQAAALVKRLLSVATVRFTDTGCLVKRVALCGGSGSDLWRIAKASGADLLITADCKYHEAQHAWLSPMNLLDLGHDDSERPALEPLAARLRNVLTDQLTTEIMVLNEPSLWQSE